ncbi:MAG: hypothetical protein NC092_03615 [Butyrivibrio sp.]|nr:hypothetical protein [Muribaculum sp.]MCM1551761.1 hypothetical protein [Butyrivibrio sp.]
MNRDQDRCPLCSRKLVMVAGCPTCPDCGYRNPYQAAASQGQMSGQYSTQGGARKTNNGLAIGVFVAAFVTIVAMMVALVASGVYLLNNYEEKIADSGTRSESGGRRGSDSNGKSGADTAADKREIVRPEDGMLAELVEAIFGKNMDSVTQDELDSIVYLEFYELGESDITAVGYMLTDGSGATYVPKNQRLNTSDLNCLCGLTGLVMEEELDWRTDWSNLTELKILRCGSPLPTIAAAMDVSNLVWVEAKSDLIDGGFGGIEQFESLEHLAMDADYVESIKGISKLTSLKELILTDAERLQDYEELYDMPQLEVLAIESGKLRDIGFVRDMEQLVELDLIGTDLKRLDAIEDCADTLETLRLERNYGVDDYSVVLECTNLVELELFVDYKFDVPMQAPDLSGLTQLKYLHLGNYDRFENLAKLTQLEELTLEDAGSGDGDFLGALTNLRQLNLIDMSVYEGFLDDIYKLHELETIDLTDSYVWDDISIIFHAPSLKWVYMNDVDAGLDVNNMALCFAMEELDMTGVTLHKLLEDGSWDYQSQGRDAEIALSDIPEFFDFFPYLHVLYIPGHELEDVSFLADMANLTYLDISDNYITDLSPLKGLLWLEVVVCRDNPLHDREGMENVMLIE